MPAQHLPPRAAKTTGVAEFSSAMRNDRGRGGASGDGGRYGGFGGGFGGGAGAGGGLSGGGAGIPPIRGNGGGGSPSSPRPLGGELPGASGGTAWGRPFYPTPTYGSGTAFLNSYANESAASGGGGGYGGGGGGFGAAFGGTDSPRAQLLGRSEAYNVLPASDIVRTAARLCREVVT